MWLRTGRYADGAGRAWILPHAVLILFVIVMTVDARDAGATQDALDEQTLVALAPYVSQIVNLAQYDPVLAARLVPDDWIESLVEQALSLEAEEPEQLVRKDAPRGWPVGPWASPEALATTIRELRPGAVGALYRSLDARIDAECSRRGRSSRRCEQAMRASVTRLSDAAVLARAEGGPTPPITATQRELARLGRPVVLALRDQCRALGRHVWGPDWNGAR